MTAHTTDNGDTRDYTVGLIGAELEASLSPALHEHEAAALGLRCVYERLDLAALGLEPQDSGTLLGEVQRAGFAGVNVTHPCKRVVVEHLDELSPVARTLGAVNTVVFSDGRRRGHKHGRLGLPARLHRRPRWAPRSIASWSSVPGARAPPWPTPCSRWARSE